MNSYKLLILVLATIGLSSAKAEQFGEPVNNVNLLKISTLMATPDNYLDVSAQLNPHTNINATYA
ncbi:MAG: hypothetical protein ACTH7Q_15665 [Pseudoalteromonas sp.]